MVLSIISIVSEANKLPYFPNLSEFSTRYHYLYEIGYYPQLELNEIDTIICLNKLLYKLTLIISAEFERKAGIIWIRL